MKSNPKVTVLMSVYNNEKYLSEAIDSILNQTFKDFEFIIVNDASIDGTLDILKRYKDPRLQIINNKENIGLTRSLNMGLQIAKGDYIARQDADDISAPDRLKKEIDFLDTHKEHAVTGTSVKVIDENSKVIRLLDRPTEDEQIRKFLRVDNCINHGSVMMRKIALDKVGQYDENMTRSQDYELWLRISKEYLLGNLSEYLYFWRKHAENIEAKNLVEQKIFVALGIAKNNISNVERVAIQFINTMVYKRKNIKVFPFNILFKLIRILTFNRIKMTTLYCLLFRVRFSKKIIKTLKEFGEKKINSEEAESMMKDISNKILS
jgi:glycosyltransferase involved in cell wall biosynthesis